MLILPKLCKLSLNIEIPSNVVLCFKHQNIRRNYNKNIKAKNKIICLAGCKSGVYPTNNYNVYDVANSVIKDIETLGRSIRIINGYNGKITENEYRIALRVGTENLQYQEFNDYHFMKQVNTGQWADKHGRTGDSYGWVLYYWKNNHSNYKLLNQDTILINTLDEYFSRIEEQKNEKEKIIILYLYLCFVFGWL